MKHRAVVETVWEPSAFPLVGMKDGVPKRGGYGWRLYVDRRPIASSLRSYPRRRDAARAFRLMAGRLAPGHYVIVAK